MSIISSRQIKAARGMLDWTQQDLSTESNISISTIRTIELGKIPRENTMNEIRLTFEKRGIEFIGQDGVRSRVIDIRNMRGANACDELFREIALVAAGDKRDVLTVIKSELTLTRNSGISYINNIARFEYTQSLVDVKCLLVNMPKPTFNVPSFAVRHTPTGLIGTEAQIIYGDRYAQITSYGHYDFMVVIFDVPDAANRNREDFSNLWNCSAPLQL